MSSSNSKVVKVITKAREMLRALDGVAHEELRSALGALVTQHEAFLRSTVCGRLRVAKRRAANLRNVASIMETYRAEADAYWQRGEAKHFGPVTQPPAGPAENDFSPAAEAQRAQMLDAAVEAKHTPLPWQALRNEDLSWTIATDKTTPTNNTGIARNINAAANAAFIVEACNNYERVKAERDELLAVLELALKVAYYEKHPARPWHDEARAAIAKAKGAR